jgi:hypothetical protein
MVYFWVLEPSNRESMFSTTSDLVEGEVVVAEAQFEDVTQAWNGRRLGTQPQGENSSDEFVI